MNSPKYYDIRGKTDYEVFRRCATSTIHPTIRIATALCPTRVSARCTPPRPDIRISQGPGLLIMILELIQCGLRRPLVIAPGLLQIFMIITLKQHLYDMELAHLRSH